MLSGVAASEAFLYCDIHDEKLERIAPGWFRLQRGGDLGEKLRHCLEELLSEGFRRAIVMGSDSPTLPIERIGDANSALVSADVVLGPSEDGGFYLIGARATDPRMLDGVTWSDDETRAQTVQAVKAVGLSVAELAEWYDVDEPSDLDRLALDPSLSDRLRRWFVAL